MYSNPQKVNKAFVDFLCVIIHNNAGKLPLF